MCCRLNQRIHSHNPQCQAAVCGWLQCSADISKQRVGADNSQMPPTTPHLQQEAKDKHLRMSCGFRVVQVDTEQTKTCSQAVVDPQRCLTAQINVTELNGGGREKKKQLGCFSSIYCTNSIDKTNSDVTSV